MSSTTLQRVSAHTFSSWLRLALRDAATPTSTGKHLFFEVWQRQECRCLPSPGLPRVKTCLVRLSSLWNGCRAAYSLCGIRTDHFRAKPDRFAHYGCRLPKCLRACTRSIGRRCLPIGSGREHSATNSTTGCHFFVMPKHPR